jgi:DNA-binding transcriptional regulator YdaS (Cro superfamily)
MQIVDVIERAGGVTALARMLDVHHSAVIGWRQYDRIPVKRAQQIHQKLGIDLHELRPDIWPAPPAKPAPTPKDLPLFPAAPTNVGRAA